MQGTAADLIKIAMISVDDWILSSAAKIRMIFEEEHEGAIRQFVLKQGGGNYVFVRE